MINGSMNMNHKGLIECSDAVFENNMHRALTCARDIIYDANAYRST